MKAWQLIDKLKKIDPETEILLSSDSEGNSFWLLSKHVDKVNFYNNIERFSDGITIDHGLTIYEDGDLVEGEIRKGIILYPE